MDTRLHPIGVIRSQLRSRAECPKQGPEGAPDAWLELKKEYASAAGGLAIGDQVVLLTWLHQANRQTQRVRPRNNPSARLTGVFATRSPDRPNPIGLHEVEILELDGTRLRVQPLEVVDGTPVVDIKPVLRCKPASRTKRRNVRQSGE